MDADEGARSGTFSQPAVKRPAATTTNVSRAGQKRRGRQRVIMKTITILVPMHLAGQARSPLPRPRVYARGRGRHSTRVGVGAPRASNDAGYAMAVLLVGLSVLGVLPAMPVWKQTIQREKEAELVFRGEQYPRHRLVPEEVRQRVSSEPRCAGRPEVPAEEVQGSDHERRLRPRAPKSECDARQRLTNGGATRPDAVGGAEQSSDGSAANHRRHAGAVWRWGARCWPAGGINGVTSKSKDVSIRLYKGRSHYNEWLFVYTPQTQAPGGAGAGAPGAPGGRGGPGGGQPPTGGLGGIGRQAGADPVDAVRVDRTARMAQAVVVPEGTSRSRRSPGGPQPRPPGR